MGEKMDDLWSDLLHDNDLRKGSGNLNNVYGHHHYATESLSCTAQRVITSINPPKEYSEKGNKLKEDLDTIIGFKELRLSTFNQIEFLLTHFPCSRFIFNVRDYPEALRKSQDKYLDPSDNLIEKSDKVPKVHRYLVQRLGHKRVYFMDMAQWSNNAKEFTNLAKWLGYNEHCEFPRVLKDNVVVKDIWLEDENRFKLHPSCSLIE